MKDIPANDDAALLRTFERFDTNGDGFVDEEEFRAILRSLGEDPSKEVLSLEFAAMDTNADGMVEFQEFKGWWLDYR